VILDREGRVVQMTLHNENTRSYPGKVVEMVKKLQDEAGNSSETRSDSGSGSTVKNWTNVDDKKPAENTSLSVCDEKPSEVKR
jgi:hypothetical protein